MASGGKRPGSGRPKGSQNRTTKARREAVQRIAEAETTPLDVLNAGMIHHYEQWKAGKADSDLAAAVEYAAKAAPYVHPRLQSLDATVTGDNVHTIISEAPLTVDEWKRKYASGDNVGSANGSAAGSD